MMEMELLCEWREPVVRASLAKEDRLALSGMGGASLLPLFLLRPNNDLPPLDVRPLLSPEENMLASVCGERVVEVLPCVSGGCCHAASGGQERCASLPSLAPPVLRAPRCRCHHISRALLFPTKVHSSVVRKRKPPSRQP